MLGLALEGGGAKGAYHMGAVKAYLEAGYEFDGVVGTSIGALNGAVIAQGDFEVGYRMWLRMDIPQVLDIDEPQYRKLLDRRIDQDAIRHLADRIKRIIRNRGMDTGKIRRLIENVVDESKLRQSETDFGLVTVSLSDRKPLELYKEDIPEGRLTDYIIASLTFPGFELQRIDEKVFVDGGLYNNLPINLLARKGYKEIIAVRTLGLGVVRNMKAHQARDLNITAVIPSESLGGTLNFSNASVRRNLLMGYYDAQRRLRGLKGSLYYFYSEGLHEERFVHALASIPESSIFAIGKMLGIAEMPPKRMLFEKVLPKLSDLLKLPETLPYHEIVIRLFETLAEAKGMDKYRIYSFDEFLRQLNKLPMPETMGIYPSKQKLLHAVRELSAVFELF